MWARNFEESEANRVAFGEGATIDVLCAEPSAELAAIRVTVAAGARIGEHDHGASDALLLPLAGRLTLRDRDGELHLAPGMVALIAAGERVSVENPREAPASMIVCFAPPTFVTELLARSAGGATAEPVGAVKAAGA